MNTLVGTARTRRRRPYDIRSTTRFADAISRGDITALEQFLATASHWRPTSDRSSDETRLPRSRGDALERLHGTKTQRRTKTEIDSTHFQCTFVVMKTGRKWFSG
jgi:hypothetical protein